MAAERVQRARRPRRPARARTPRPAANQRPPDHFGALFENANDIVIVNDRRGRIVAANRAAREFAGYSAEDVVRGVSLREVLPPDEYQAAMVLTARALDGLPIPEVYERQAVLRDGRHRVLELRSSCWQVANGSPLLQTIGRDVTERKEAAAFQNGLLQVSQALLTAQGLDELGRVVCEAASRVLQVNGASLWLRCGDELVGLAAAGRDAAHLVGLRRSLTDSFIGQIYRAADVLMVNDFAHSLYARDHVWDTDVQALLAVPLRRGATPVGVLVFTDDSNPRRFTAVLRERALIFGAQTAVAIESALAREREEEEGRISAALLRVTRAIREPLEQAEVLREIARGARDAVQCDWAFVALRGAAHDALRVVAAEGWPHAFDAELRLIEFDPETFPELRPLLAQQTIEVPQPPREALYSRWQVSSFLSAPMVRAGRLTGAISVGYRQRRGPFSARERRIAEDVAAQAAVAVENARLVEDLRAANRLKSEFLGTMSHELRTPLNAILGYADLLHEAAMGPVTAEQVEALDRVLLNGRSLLELINMTLDVNRLEAGRVAVQPSEFALDELLAGLQNEFAVRTAAGPVALAWPQRGEIPLLYTDHAKLKAVLRNLVDNALKFTPGGSVTVAVRYDAESDRVCLTVHDTGIGIPAHALASIFEMFQQVEGTTPASRGGVGLGLYVVRRYAELLGGTAAVQSAAGTGSTFTVDIPRRLPNGTPA
jgi:PAS domain S-box-containing protein